MEQHLTKLNSIKTISLTEVERNLLRAHAAHIMVTKPSQSIESLFRRGVHHGLRIALSSFLFVVFVGGSVSAVADNALPGDPLYSFKLNVNEQVKGFFLKTPEEKVVYTKARIETRMKEMTTLAQSNTLTKEKQATVQKAIDDHVADLSTDLTALSSVAPSTALNVTATLETSLQANKDTLLNSSTGTSTATTDAIKTVDNALKKVSDQEVKIISKEIDSISTDISTTTDTSASTTTDTQIAPPVTPAAP
jgi:uncharacterized protein YbcI